MSYQRSALRRRVVPIPVRSQASGVRTAQSWTKLVLARLAQWAKTIAHGLVK
jgi:hypothetical protein